MNFKARILIINDRHSEVWYIGQILQKEGFDIRTAFDGLEGLSKVQEEKPDLIILDTIMPKMDGYKVYHHLQKDPITACIPVLFLTVRREADERRMFASGSHNFATGRRKQVESRQATAVDFLTKPVIAEAVVERLQALLQFSKSRTSSQEIKNTKSRILIVDDDRSLVQLTVQALQKVGFDVLTAFDGLEGLRKAQEEKPDLIILDTIMPELNGLQVLSSVRRNSNVPVTMLTERSEVDLLKKAMALGADSYVIKPFSINDLLARVQAKLQHAG
ncbi:MAG: response regulator [Dehalococcoidales bacterium]